MAAASTACQAPQALSWVRWAEAQAWVLAWCLGRPWGQGPGGCRWRGLLLWGLLLWVLPPWVLLLLALPLLALLLLMVLRLWALLLSAQLALLAPLLLAQLLWLVLQLVQPRMPLVAAGASWRKAQLGQRPWALQVWRASLVVSLSLLSVQRSAPESNERLTAYMTASAPFQPLQAMMPCSLLACVVEGAAVGLVAAGCPVGCVKGTPLGAAVGAALGEPGGGGGFAPPMSAQETTNTCNRMSTSDVANRDGCASHGEGELMSTSDKTSCRCLHASVSRGLAPPSCSRVSPAEGPPPDWQPMLAQSAAGDGGGSGAGAGGGAGVGQFA